MVDFTTPNLCGASPEFNKLVSQFDSIKESLKGKLEAEIDLIKSEVGSSLSVLDADMKSLIPELPSTPDISFISEIQNLAALPSGGLSSLSALANLQSQFGSALSGAGFSLDSLVGDATAAFSGGIDLCGGGLPNFVIGPNGLPALKPEDVGMPSTDPERLDEDDLIVEEAASSLLTPSAEISSTNSGLAGAAGKALEEVKKRLPKMTISSEGGNISLSARIEYDKQDVLIEANNIKNKLPSTPQIQKRANAAATNLNLPAKAPATSPDEILVEIQVFQERVNIARNAFTDSFNRTQGLFKKSSNDPFSIFICPFIYASGKESSGFINNFQSKIKILVLCLSSINCLQNSFIISSKNSFRFQSYVRKYSSTNLHSLMAIRIIGESLNNCYYPYFNFYESFVLVRFYGMYMKMRSILVVYLSIFQCIQRNF